jgi:hypothetical protein
MKQYIKHYLWFHKESISFMGHKSKLWVVCNGIVKAHKFALDMMKWERMSPEQREAWYLSGEGRTWEVDA